MKRASRVAVLAGILAITTCIPIASHAEATYPNDPYFGQQWYLNNTGQNGGTPGADIHALQAWAITKCSPNVTIAILDTGVDATHPDLASKVLPGASFVPGVSSPADDNGHGTMVAGVAAAATDNGVGIAGVCPGGKILPVKVADSAGHTGDPTGDLQVAQGIKYAVSHGARVLNLSLGTPDSSFMRDAADYAWRHNAIVVGATPGGSNWPSDYPHAIAVDGTTAKDTLAHAATHAAPNLVLAPMAGIFTTSRGGSYADFCTCESVAAPIVSGIAALILSIRPDLVTDQVIHAIEQGADRLSGQQGVDTVRGWGRVNAYRSLQIAQKMPVFALKLTLKSAVSRGARQSLSISTRPKSQISLAVSYGGKTPRTSHGKSNAKGAWTHTWKVPRSREKVTVTVVVTSDQGQLERTRSFTIR